jgi:hypothetical protein
MGFGRKFCGAVALFAAVLLCAVVVGLATGFIDMEMSPLLILSIVIMGSTSTGAYFTIRGNEEKNGESK